MFLGGLAEKKFTNLVLQSLKENIHEIMNKLSLKLYIFMSGWNVANKDVLSKKKSADKSFLGGQIVPNNWGWLVLLRWDLRSTIEKL
jgi:isocitrate lyase